MTNLAKLLAVVILGATVLVPVCAHATSDACQQELARFCRGVKPGKGRVVACLKSHQSELSADCQAQLTASMEKAPAFVKACRADAAKLCSGITIGGGQAFSCLKSHQAEVSSACKEQLAK